MSTLIDTFWLLSIQFAVGSALLAGVARLRARGASSRRKRAAWARAAPTLLRASRLGIIPAGLLWPVRETGVDAGILVMGSIATAGGVLLYAASRLERRGRLRAAASQVRLGGNTIAVGLALLLSWLTASAGFAGTFEPGNGIAVLMLGAAAFVALLGGLSAKPRPSCHAAALLYLSGLALLVSAG